MAVFIYHLGVCILCLCEFCTAQYFLGSSAELRPKEAVMPRILCIAFCILKGVESKILCGWKKADSIARGGLAGEKFLLQLFYGFWYLRSWVRGENI